jgi:hypothetical protein
VPRHQATGDLCAEVSFKDKLARVMYEKGVVTVEQMIEAVKRAGFLATPQ